MRGSRFQIDWSRVARHEADEPDAGCYRAQAEALAGEDGRDGDPSALAVDGAAGLDDAVAVVRP